MTLPMRVGLGQFNTLTDEMLTFIKQIGVDDFLMTPFGAHGPLRQPQPRAQLLHELLVGDGGHDNVVRAIRRFPPPGAWVRVVTLRRLLAANCVHTSGSGNAGQRLLTELLDGIQCLPHVVPGRGVVEDAQPEGKGPV